MTVDALHAGKDVFCEKPMTSLPEQGLEVVKAVRTTSLPVVRTAFTTSRPCSGSEVIGFSQKTSLPACSASTVMRECQWSVDATMTASTSCRSSSHLHQFAGGAHGLHYLQALLRQ